MARGAQIVLAVGILTLATVSTTTKFDPVVAHFRLVVVFVDLALESVVPTLLGLVSCVFAFIVTVRLRLRGDPPAHDIGGRYSRIDSILFGSSGGGWCVPAISVTPSVPFIGVIAPPVGGVSGAAATVAGPAL